jgi:hypothetical protein
MLLKIVRDRDLSILILPNVGPEYFFLANNARTEIVVLVHAVSNSIGIEWNVKKITFRKQISVSTWDFNNRRGHTLLLCKSVIESSSIVNFGEAL